MEDEDIFRRNLFTGTPAYLRWSLRGPLNVHCELTPPLGCENLPPALRSHTVMGPLLLTALLTSCLQAQKLVQPWNAIKDKPSAWRPTCKAGQPSLTARQLGFTLRTHTAASSPAYLVKFNMVMLPEGHRRTQESLESQSSLGQNARWINRKILGLCKRAEGQICTTSFSNLHFLLCKTGTQVSLQKFSEDNW